MNSEVSFRVRWEFGNFPFSLACNTPLVSVLVPITTTKKEMEGGPQPAIVVLTFFITDSHLFFLIYIVKVLGIFPIYFSYYLANILERE